MSHSSVIELTSARSPSTLSLRHLCVQMRRRQVPPHLASQKLREIFPTETWVSFGRPKTSTKLKIVVKVGLGEICWCELQTCAAIGLSLLIWSSGGSGAALGDIGL